MAAILLIEDDPDIRGLLEQALTSDGHRVLASPTGLAALEMVVNDRPDLVVLDLGLPDIDGAELLRMIRAVSTVPIIVATARSADRDLVEALDRGADEYVVKPFSAAEMQARIRALLRRMAAPEEIVVGELVIDNARRTATLAGTELELRRKEFDILACLAANAGTVVRREDLFAEVWQQPDVGADKTIDVHISWLRNKLGEKASDPRYLHTVRGVGYRLASPE